MSMRTIVEFNHDYAHDMDETIGKSLELAMGSGSEESWAPLKRLGIRRIVMRHHSYPAKVVTPHRTYDVAMGLDHENDPIPALHRKALERIADEKASSPVAVARKALHRHATSNKPLSGAPLPEDEALPEAIVGRIDDPEAERPAYWLATMIEWMERQGPSAGDSPGMFDEMIDKMKALQMAIAALPPVEPQKVPER